MSFKSSGFRVKRSLSFGSKEPQDLPYAGRTFYIDVKSSSLKSKISQRVLNLGGQIENFLSKDLTLLITDKQENVNKVEVDHEHLSQTSALKHSKTIPLSRGQALLLKASGQSNSSISNNSHGLVQSATKLGIEIQTPTVFLQSSSKLLAKVKKLAQKSKRDDPMCDMSPISWDEDKENLCVIKVEDEDGIFRPLFKHFEKFPQICYSECGSPFDVGIVLTKENENNQVKKKAVSGRVQLGGYCESCDHWYKCSLREHLSSIKHKKFITKTENFTSLNEVTLSLPDFDRFVYKHGLRKDNIFSHGEILSTRSYTGSVLSDKKVETAMDMKLSSKKENSKFGSPFASYRNINSEIWNSNEQVEKTIPKNHAVTHENVSESFDIRSEVSKPSTHLRNSERFSLDDVLKSVTDAEYQDETNKTDILNSFHGNSELPSNFCDICSTDMHKNATLDSSKNSLTVSRHDANCLLDKETASVKNEIPANFTPDANFSSSSFSFGDTGVSNVLSMLNNDNANLTYPSLNTSVNVECISVVSKCEKHELQEDINIGRSQETTSGLNDELTVTDKKSAAGYQFQEYSNITEESNQSKPQNNDKTTRAISQMPSLDFHCLNFDTDLFGKDTNSVTPSKEHMDSLRADIHIKKANTGSTIRNWLIPMDDNAAVDSPVGLDTTLVDTSLNGANNEKHIDKDRNKFEEMSVDVKDIEETTDTSKVAAWIQNHIFDGEINAEKCIRTNVTAQKCADIVDKFDEKLQNIDDIGMDESCSVRKYNTGLSGDDSNSAWSESGTSISDCTLPNFRANASQEAENHILDCNKDDDHHITGNQKSVLTDSDNASVKSCLSSSVTARGIKITGLSLLKTDSKSDKSLDIVQAHGNTMTSNSYLRGPEVKSLNNVPQEAIHQRPSHDDKTNKNSSSTAKLFEQSVVHRHVPVVQNLAQTIYRPIAPVPANQTIYANEPRKSAVKINLKNNEKPKGRKAPASRSKRNNAPAVKKPIPSQTPCIVGVYPGEPYNYFQQNQISSSHTNAMPNNQFYPTGNQQPLMKQYGYHLNSPSNLVNSSKNDNPYPQMQAYMGSAYSPFGNGTGMMDLLLSPGSQQPTSYGQTQVSQKQCYYPQAVHQGMNFVQSPQNTHLYTKNTGFNEMNSQQRAQYGHENASPHFLSQNSNFLAYGYQQPSPKPTLISGFPQSSTFPSPGDSKQDGHLQTIDLSHIAESNSNDFTASFNVVGNKQTKTVEKKVNSQISRKQSSKKILSTVVKNALESRSSVQYNSGAGAKYSNFGTTTQMSTTSMPQPTARISSVMSNQSTVQCNSDAGAKYSNLGTTSQMSTTSMPRPTAQISSVMSNQSTAQYNSDAGAKYSNLGTTSQMSTTSMPRPTAQISSVRSCVQQNQWVQSGALYMSSQSLNPYACNSVPTLNAMQHGYTQNQGQTQFVQTAHQTGYKKPAVYNTVQTGDMKLTFRKISSSNNGLEQSRHDLMHYWNVRKAGDCRLVFSANVLGKRKAEETPIKDQFMNDSLEIDSPNCEQPLSKKRRCLIY